MARPKKEKMYLFDKRAELVWALDYQDYNGEDIGTVFNVHRSQISRILARKPKGWKPKWIKIQ